MQTNVQAVSPVITLKELLTRFKGKISITLGLVIAESVLDLLFPLFIGFAINGLLNQNYMGLIALGGLGVLALIIGSGRRFFDTRAYADIYVTTANEMVASEQQKENPISTTAARVSLLTEFIEFLENSMPVIVTSLIGLVGIIAIIFTLNRAVFWACVGLLALMGIVYLLSGRLNFRFNQMYNDQLEKQVDALATREADTIHNHFQAVMRWNIKLSDLETLNYGLIWLGIIALLVYSPVVVIGGGVTNYGLVFSVLMYVFQYIESVVALPYYIQQLIRLQEISTRLSG